MQSDLKVKLTLIKKALFSQETKLKDIEHSAKELGTRLNNIRTDVI